MKYIYQINILSIFIEQANLIELDELLKDVYSHREEFWLLQDFIGRHIKKEYSWMTALSIIDASEDIVRQAKENGNLAQNAL